MSTLKNFLLSYFFIFSSLSLSLSLFLSFSLSLSLSLSLELNNIIYNSTFMIKILYILYIINFVYFL